MHTLDDDPLLWLVEFGQGLARLTFVLFCTGLWTLLVGHLRFPHHAKLPLCLFGIFLLSFYASQIFDPATHIVGSFLGAVSMAFTSPLQAAAWLTMNASNPDHPTARSSVLLRVAIPAGLLSARHPPEHPVTQICRGVVYLTIGAYASSLFDKAVARGGVQVDALGATFIVCAATGALNLESAALGLLGKPCPSPFTRPLLSSSLARFWSGRWNKPVSDSLRIAVYDPLRKLHGFSKPFACMACFVVSGLAHELVLLYCGIYGSRGEWFLFFVLSGVATLAETRVHGLVKNGVVRYLYAAGMFYALFHFLFLPVTLRTGIAQAGAHALRTGPVVVKYLYSRYA